MRPGKAIWADLEAAMVVLAGKIRAADFPGIEASSDRVRDLANELGDAVSRARQREEHREP